MPGRQFPELMTPAEVGAALGVAPATVRRWKLRSFQTPAVSGQGHRRYFRAEVDAILAGKPLTAAELDALIRGEQR